ncbi:TPA: relaxase/mobilization nuclease domain-containing protein [Pseudomonas aeruginosa]|nr:relaxase/mobilization nuclease domain-containing protein [Pseudomonas aeruginosa]HEQ1694944.1 relaxase/mobilization nuclease domain-containing protein [Pseudomonas aeruginosa]HEQ1730682.1 relaxase/mobilization nuclease domain-containing protein [Pseudomonas aeruginosa]HEQ1737175.1 relaxase/mobilization nuclease domain-containing protein [Pseudomonas aeruginosa]HEQ1789920.1 relaxase/mobilization nuclease domain-containing protein [Pseudomonas aeruginosa]
MIAKHVPMRSLGKSDFAGLVNYVTDAQNKEHRLGLVQITNCDAGSVRDAITEILATQYTNTRAKSDKTYHLIVSFRAGEQPDADTLRAVEERICAGLGYGEHQRISAVHNDTDNLHIHIAINKIHPTRHTMHEPYYPHLALADLCETLERDYGLEADNHRPQQRGAASRAADMERHAGVESLVGWIKRKCLDDIKAAQSWTELHQVMRDNGLEITPRGNGLVIRADDGTMVKPSSLARDLSKPALEKRLGAFEASPDQQEKPPRRQYQKKPVRSRADTTELYARYKDEQKNLTAARAEALAAAKRRKDRAVVDAKQKAATKRAAIKLAGGGRVAKKLLYSQTSATLRAELDGIYKGYSKERERLHQGHQRRQWADWLKQEATQGNSEALAALRVREAAQGLKGNTVKGQGQAKPGHAPVIDNITKAGTIIYRAGASAVRDDGDRLQVSTGTDRAGVQEALRLAAERYGSRITVNGTTEFKAQAIWAAVDGKLPITFADPALEKRRLALLQDNFSVTSKPGVPGVGKVPPPVARAGRLRSLSQAEALQIEGAAAAVTPQKPASTPAPAPGELERRKAKLQAELNAKKEKAKQRRGRGR